MNGKSIFTKKRIFLIGLVIAVAICVTEAYVNSPTILMWINPENSISINGVYYPTQAYRSQDLPITVCLSNIGDAKDVIVEVASMDSSTLSNNIQLDGSQSRVNTTFWLPLSKEGNQSFSIEAIWAGPGGFCRIEQNSTNEQFEVLGADYECTSPTVIASQAEGFEWTLSVTNVGNTPANLTVQLCNNSPLILSDNSESTALIPNIQVGETCSVNFNFDVPYSASLGDHTITISLTTAYPDIDYYHNCQEVTYQTFNYNIQASSIKTEIDNTSYLLGSVLGLAVICAAIFAVLTKKRRMD
jgi:hypothetical protein